MRTDEAGRRLILLSLPFLGFGLLWAIRPPIGDALPEEILAVTQALGVALAFLGLAAIGLGIWLIRRDDERIL